eukprot:1186034-Prorocentrum_minimum.AAC.1
MCAPGREVLFGGLRAEEDGAEHARHHGALPSPSARGAGHQQSHAARVGRGERPLKGAACSTARYSRRGLHAGMWCAAGVENWWEN